MTLMAKALCMTTDDTDEDANRVLVEDVMPTMSAGQPQPRRGCAALRDLRRRWPWRAACTATGETRLAAGALSFPTSIGVRCVRRLGVRIFLTYLLNASGLAEEPSDS